MEERRNATITTVEEETCPVDGKNEFYSFIFSLLCEKKCKTLSHNFATFLHILKKDGVFDSDENKELFFTPTKS